ncbi:fumarylacetoacetate hydrolase family protein [Streptomyces sp. TLI_171]|uniref:fumarylacetoacetate hydrolase family protein n=1 Tax=Streptomyces sp. TLI_171 TaxID=1938859 RepID=UPI000C1A7BF1|nr:fumarylacetoacetate hydrolase family protein [Streptomyces sp. TLI_171]RKE21316.1 2-keto-4-pentenoate hydratase/2-oxohepta-3-ene-1,7-dioic acid hydratase in catechol pathway [Streptomyces sp. TLI_171]
MRIARFSVREGSPAAGSVSFGIIEGDAAQPESLVVHTLAGHPFGTPQPTGETHRLQDVRLLAPMLPSKIVAVGRNYAAHAAELGHEVPDVPLTFFKPSTAVIGPTESIAYPPFSSDVQYEAELAVVIGRMCREVPLERVPEVVFGYTCANDVTARDVQQREGQWARAKGFDTSCPLGPWIETDLDPADLAVTCTVNGELRQAGRTSQMVRSVAELIVHISEAMTLLPGDVVLTGTPAGVGPLNIGDEVAVSVEGIGTLSNKVIKRG